MSDGTYLPWLINQSHVSYQVQSTWLFSCPLSLVLCLYFVDSGGVQMPSSVSGDVLLASTPTASSSVQAMGSFSLPCLLHVTHMHDASVASGDSRGTMAAVVCSCSTVLRCCDVCRGKPKCACFWEVRGGTRSC